MLVPLNPALWKVHTKGCHANEPWHVKGTRRRARTFWINNGGACNTLSGVCDKDFYFQGLLWIHANFTQMHVSFLPSFSLYTHTHRHTHTHARTHTCTHTYIFYLPIYILCRQQYLLETFLKFHIQVHFLRFREKTRTGRSYVSPWPLRTLLSGST